MSSKVMISGGTKSSIKPYPSTNECNIGRGNTKPVIFEAINDETAIVPTEQVYDKDFPKVSFTDLAESIRECASIDHIAKLNKEMLGGEDKCDVEITFTSKSIKDIAGDKYDQVCKVADKILDNIKETSKDDERRTSDSSDN